MERIPELSGKGTFQRYDYDWAQMVIDHLLSAAMGASGNDKDSLKKIIVLWFQGLGKEIFGADIEPHKD